MRASVRRGSTGKEGGVPAAAPPDVFAACLGLGSGSGSGFGFGFGFELGLGFGFELG